MQGLYGAELLSTEKLHHAQPSPPEIETETISKFRNTMNKQKNVNLHG